MTAENNKTAPKGPINMRIAVNVMGDWTKIVAPSGGVW